MSSKRIIPNNVLTFFDAIQIGNITNDTERKRNRVCITNPYTMKRKHTRHVWVVAQKIYEENDMPFFTWVLMKVSPYYKRDFANKWIGEVYMVGDVLKTRKTIQGKTDDETITLPRLRFIIESTENCFIVDEKYGYDFERLENLIPEKFLSAWKKFFETRCPNPVSKLATKKVISETSGDEEEVQTQDVQQISDDDGDESF
jgi:hypothetical protein